MPLEIRASKRIIDARLRSEAGLSVDPWLKQELESAPGKFAAITPLIDAAVAKLDAAGVWPSHAFAPYHIELDFGSAIETHWANVKNAAAKRDGRTFTVDPKDPLRISIGLDIVSGALFQGLAKRAKASDIDVMALLLAHESFHLREPEHMSRSGVSHDKTMTGFARGIHPEFSDQWQRAMKLLASEFPAYRGPDSAYAKKSSLTMWKAADIANEACNDLLALMSLKPPGFDQAALASAVAAERQSEEKRALASGLDGAGHAASPDYQIGTAVASLIPHIGKDDGWAIREAAWTLAFQTALQEKIDLSSDVREVILVALKHPSRAPSPVEKKSIFKRLFG